MNKHPIYILDDDRDTLELLNMVLVAEGYPVMVCNDADHALRELATCAQPCVLLLDLSLIRSAPLDFIQQVRKINNPVHFVLMTGQDAKRRAQELGLDYFVQKPFDPFDLLAKIHHLYEGCKGKSL